MARKDGLQSNKDGYQRVALQQATYIRLKEMADKNHCSLSQLIEDATSKLSPDNAGNVYNKLSRIEEYLQKTGIQFDIIKLGLSRIDVSRLPGIVEPAIPPNTPSCHYHSEEEIKKLQADEALEHEEALKQYAVDEAKREEYRKKRMAEADRDATIARGEDVVERRVRKGK